MCSLSTGKIRNKRKETEDYLSEVNDEAAALLPKRD
jgi:hypothetical protein